MTQIRNTGLAFSLALSVAIMVLPFCEWHTDETGVVFVVLLSLAAAIGYLVPRYGWLGGSAIGASIPVAHFA